MITDERNKKITEMLTRIDTIVDDYIYGGVNQVALAQFTEEEVFHMRQIFGQRLRRYTAYGDREKEQTDNSG